MTGKLATGLFLLLITNHCFSQAASDSLLNLGNKFYKNKEFDKAGKTWVQSAALADNKITKQTNYFYAAIAFAEGKDSTNTFKCLELAITKNGFNDLPALNDDETFGFINKSKKWADLLNKIKPVYTTNPKKVKVIDSDVRNFWKAYDQIGNDNTKAVQIYKANYFAIGTMALQYYLVNKINTIDNFVYIHQLKKKYYESIRGNTFKAGQLKPEYQKIFIKLKQVYPQAIFPPIYFVVGKLNSAGTVCSYGLILGIDQACMSPTADTSELNTWEKHNISSFANLKHTVAHELIHYEQNDMASDTTLLAASIKEGMADFLGELISGKTTNERLKAFARGKERQIWTDFKKEMYLDRASNWIANSDQETAEKPADLGYWVGYMICKSYYENSSDKAKAIYDMLHIKNYKTFLADSKIEDTINK